MAVDFIPDTLRRLSDDELVWVKVGTAGSSTLAKVSLGSAYANYNAEVLIGNESDGTTKTELPTAAVDSSGVLTLTEATDGFEDGDKYLVLVTQANLPWETPSMTTT